VIYSDDAEPALLARRRTLALALGEALEEARFLPYAGPSYAHDYASIGEAGVFLDRRPRNARIFVLHRPRMPSVLVETHNALHDLEAVRWDAPETRNAFAAAVARALIAALSGENGDRRKALL
jgi:N-acetylmuramoyl-L-alanine amidase